MKPAGEALPDGFVGRSPQIAKIRVQIEKLSKGRTPVLIQGESGTGKEVIARSLYNLNPQGQFVPIDCGSLVGTMMESELFGHVRGAFTGALENKRGLLDLANGGTAFFDEIGELPLELQVKLLRVLQERELRPVGALHRVPVDIRVVAATNRDLEQEVIKGRFREDLFHRINVVRLTLPPLREHKEDIAPLLERFIESASQRYIVSRDALDAMTDYDWPGNVRELKNCLERMMAFNSGPLLQFADLPTTVMGYARAKAAQGLATVASVDGRSHVTSLAALAEHVSGPRDLVVPLQEMERQAIQNALRVTHGDRTTAANLLGIGRTTLYRKLKEYAME